MLIHLPRFWFAFILGLVCIVPKGDAQVFHVPHHQPYQDQHFNLNSTRRTDFGTLPGNSAGYVGGSTSTMDGAMLRSETMPSGGATCSGNGNCPSSRNAILRLRIPDGFCVEINGQATRPQSLGGIHQNSRIFSLEELEKDRVSPCDIVVDCPDEFGNAMRMVHTLAVQVGGHYEVRFPYGFEQIDVPYNSQIIPFEGSIDGPINIENTVYTVNPQGVTSPAGVTNPAGVTTPPVTTPPVTTPPVTTPPVTTPPVTTHPDREVVKPLVDKYEIIRAPTAPPVLSAESK